MAIDPERLLPDESAAGEDCTGSAQSQIEGDDWVEMKAGVRKRLSLPKGWDLEDGLRHDHTSLERVRAARCLFQKRPRRLRVVAQAEPGAAEVFIYDVISFFGVSATDFVKQISELDAELLRVRINSPGGDVFDAHAIHNAIARHPARTETWIDGLAASAASYVAVAADEVFISENAMLMIHDPWSIIMGNAREMRKEADILEKIGATIAEMYQKKTGMSKKKIVEAMADETWYNAKEALKAGFVDEIFTVKESDGEGQPGETIAEMNKWNLSMFARVPDEMKKGKPEIVTPSKPEVEAILREAGISHHTAKGIVAFGLQQKPDPSLREAVEGMGLGEDLEKQMLGLIQSIKSWRR